MTSNRAFRDPSTASAGNCISICFLISALPFVCVKSSIKSVFLSTRYPSGYNSYSNYHFRLGVMLLINDKLKKKKKMKDIPQLVVLVPLHHLL